jgi:hypothetical protein
MADDIKIMLDKLLSQCDTPEQKLDVLTKVLLAVEDRRIEVLGEIRRE